MEGVLFKVQPAPESWARVLELAERVGLPVDPVARNTFRFGRVNRGLAPEEVFYTGGRLYIEVSADPFHTLLHEVCHFIVAVNRGRAGLVNYGSGNLAPNGTDEDEGATSDAQVVWALVHAGPEVAKDVASHLNYGAVDGTVAETLASGASEWSQFGQPVRVLVRHRRALERAWGQTEWYRQGHR